MDPIVFRYPDYSWSIVHTGEEPIEKTEVRKVKADQEEDYDTKGVEDISFDHQTPGWFQLPFNRLETIKVRSSTSKNYLKDPN